MHLVQELVNKNLISALVKNKQFMAQAVFNLSKYESPSNTKDKNQSWSQKNVSNLNFANHFCYTIYTNSYLLLF